MGMQHVVGRKGRRWVGGFAFMLSALLWCGPLQADIMIALDSTSSTASTTEPFSWSHTVGAGSDRILVVGVGGETYSSSDLVITSVTYGGTAMALVEGSLAVCSPAGPTRVTTALYYLLNPTSGTADIAVDLAAAKRCVAGAISLVNVAQEAPEAVDTHTQTSGNHHEKEMTTLTDGAWVVDFLAMGDTTPNWQIMNANQVQRIDQVGTSLACTSSTLAVPTAGTVSMDWRYANLGQLAVSLAVFAPVPEPATLGLLAFGGLALLTRRKRRG